MRDRMNDIDLIKRAAGLYYNHDCTQSDIAERFGISRAKVSRVLAQAREKGIVKIFIDDEAGGSSLLEDRLMSRFPLKAAKVISVPEQDAALAVQITAQEAAAFFSGFLAPGDRIGVSWGYTLYTMAKYCPELALGNASVVQVTGSVDNTSTRSHAGEIVSLLSQKLHTADAYTLPCPAMLDNSIILDMLLHDAKVKKMLDLACSCNKLIVSLAQANETCCLYRADYIGDREIAQLREKNAVGSICCRFVNEEGELCDQALDDRTFGIRLSDLRGKEQVMTCVADPGKVPVLHACLRARYVDVLAIDSLSAAKLLEMDD